MKKTIKTIIGTMGVFALLILSCCTFEDCTIGEFIAIYSALIGIVYASIRVCDDNNIEEA